jgi:hypothetical protein
MIASLRRIWKQTPPGLRREVSHLKPTFGPPHGRPSLCRLVDQRTGQQADGLLMSPTADPEERAQKLDRQLVVLVRRLALQPYEEISDVHVERPGNGMEPTRCDAISPQFVLVLLLVMTPISIANRCWVIPTRTRCIRIRRPTYRSASDGRTRRAIR